MSSLPSLDCYRLVRRSRHLIPWAGALAMSVAAAQGAIQVPVVPAQVKAVTTLLTLMVIPVLYFALYRRRMEPCADATTLHDEPVEATPA